MTQRYSFDENGMRRAVKAIRRIERMPKGGRQQATQYVSSGTPELWLDGYNNSGETIPALSCVVVGSGSVLDGVYHANLTKPSTTLSRSHGLTVDADISAGGRLGYIREAGYAKYGDSSVAVGDTVGPKPGSWVLWKNYPGFIVDRVIDSSAKIMLAVPEEITSLRGKRSSGVSAGSSGAFDVYYKTGSSFTTWVDSGIDLTCECISAYTANKWAFLGLVAGQWHATPAEC